MSRRRRLAPDERLWLREHFPTTLTKDCAVHLGITESSCEHFAYRMGLHKTREHFVAQCCKNNQGRRFQKGVSNLMRLGPEHNAERIRKASESWKETRRKEEMRVRWGLEQKTRFKIGSGGRKRASCRYCLRKKGYDVGRGSNVAYYTENTQRSAKMEAWAKREFIRVKSKNGEQIES